MPPNENEIVANATGNSENDIILCLGGGRSEWLSGVSRIERIITTRMQNSVEKEPKRLETKGVK